MGWKCAERCDRECATKGPGRPIGYGGLLSTSGWKAQDGDFGEVHESGVAGKTGKMIIFVVRELI